MCPYLVMPGRQSKCYAGAANKTHWAAGPPRARGNLVTAGPGSPPAAQPSPGRAWPATDRGTAGSASLGPLFAKLFFHSQCSVLALLHVAPHAKTRSCKRHATIIALVEPFFPLLISFRVDVGLSVVFHILLILWAHNSRHRFALGTFLPVTFSSWSDVCNIEGQQVFSTTFSNKILGI